ncbi:K(+)-transporting ATPase subunit F [Zavarzinella formosa]|nr:K(+)-transporting ATPase subunit F [Zavarzinella formosa]
MRPRLGRISVIWLTVIVTALLFAYLLAALLRPEKF